MSVRRLRVLVAAVAIAFVFALVSGATGIASARADASGTTLSILSGGVMVRHAAGDFVAASDGDVLHEGDTIRTADDGRAVLTYFEGSTVTIEPDTEITIDAASTTSDGSTVVLMTEAAGRTWHVVTKLIQGGSRYEVRTPASTASVRGTEFEVDAAADVTTVTTTEGMVMQRVDDPIQPGSVVEIPVGAGTTQTQPRHGPPAPARPKPTPDRTVTMRVAASNTLVVDPLGRANGVTSDGRVIAQTPGAQVRREGGAIVVTMPDLPDGTLAARIDGAAEGADIPITTTIDEGGRSVSSDAHATRSSSGAAVAHVVIARSRDGDPIRPQLDDNSLPTPHVPRNAGSHRSLAPSPSATLGPRATDAHPSVTPHESATRPPHPTFVPVTESPRSAPARETDRAEANTEERDATPVPSRSPRASVRSGYVIGITFPTLAPASPTPRASP